MEFCAAMQRRLYRILEQTETTAARIVDFLIMTLILVSVAAFTASTVPSAYAQYGRFLENIQRFAVIVFTVEYLLRLIAAGGKPDSKGSVREGLAYATSFYGVVDLLAILPFFLAITGFLALRSLRLLRLFRLFKIGRYSRALNMFVAVLRSRASQLGVFTYVSCIFMFIAATGVYYAENAHQPEKFSSIPASLWWAVVTLTTVGYGDTYPVTTAGKIFTAFVILIGLGVIAIPTGIISAGMVEVLKKPVEKKCPHCGRNIEE
jgi:voltage-gated potassium channel